MFSYKIPQETFSCALFNYNIDDKFSVKMYNSRN